MRAIPARSAGSFPVRAALGVLAIILALALPGPLHGQDAAERVIVIADACHSARTADGATLGGAEGNAIAGSFAELFTPSRRLMMTAAETNEFSLEDARWGGHGVFTHFLLEALQGKGDANGAGVVTFAETYEHVSRSVVAATQGRQ